MVEIPDKKLPTYMCTGTHRVGDATCAMLEKKRRDTGEAQDTCSRQSRNKICGHSIREQYNVGAGVRGANPRTRYTKVSGRWTLLYVFDSIFSSITLFPYEQP